MLLIIVIRNIFLLIRAIRPGALPRVMNPAYQKIVIIFFTHAAQVGGKPTTYLICAFAHRVAAHAAARLKAFLPFHGIARRLVRQRSVNRSLVEVSGNFLDVPIVQAEARHLRRGTEGMRVFQPDGNPFGPDFHANFLQVRAHFLPAHHQVLGGHLKMVQPHGGLAGCHAQRVGLRVIVARRFIVRGVVAQVAIALGIAQVLVVLRLQLLNLLLVGHQFFRLRVVTLEAMAANAAFPLEKLLAGAQLRPMIHHHVRGVALLATGLDVGLVVQRPRPVLVFPMAHLHAIHLHPVAVVAGRATKFFRVVNSQQFRVRMAGECRGHVIFLAAHRIARQEHGLANPRVARFAAVHHATIRIVNLPDCDIGVLRLLPETSQLIGAQAVQMITDISLEFFCRVALRLEEIAFLLL